MKESQEREQVIIRRKVRRLKNGGPAACVYKSFFNEGSPPVATGGNPSS